MYISLAVISWVVAAVLGLFVLVVMLSVSLSASERFRTILYFCLLVFAWAGLTWLIYLSFSYFGGF